jgi:hypothetical protein
MCLILIDLMFCNQSRKESGVHVPHYTVPETACRHEAETTHFPFAVSLNPLQRGILRLP